MEVIEEKVKLTPIRYRLNQMKTAPIEQIKSVCEEYIGSMIENGFYDRMGMIKFMLQMETYSQEEIKEALNSSV
jgi:hypothetical protein